MKVYGFLIFLLMSASLQAKTVFEIVRDFNKPAITKAIEQQKYFSFPYRNLTSLEGIANIPGIEKAWALSVRGNNIRVIKTNTFNTPKLKGLVLLDLRENNIEAIEPGGFNGLDSLLFLLLNKNQLKELQDGALQGLPRVKYVTVGDNPNEHLIRRQAQKQLPNATIFNKEITKKWLTNALKAAGVAVVVAGVIAAVVWGTRPEDEDKQRIKRLGEQKLEILKTQGALIAQLSELKRIKNIIDAKELDIWPKEYGSAEGYKNYLRKNYPDIDQNIKDLEEELKTIKGELGVTDDLLRSLQKSSTPPIDPNVTERVATTLSEELHQLKYVTATMAPPEEASTAEQLGALTAEQLTEYKTKLLKEIADTSRARDEAQKSKEAAPSGYASREDYIEHLTTKLNKLHRQLNMVLDIEENKGRKITTTPE